jgi:hypothetical protein
MSEYGGRVVSPSMFVDLGVGDAVFTIDRADDCLCVEFRATLTDAQAATVRERLSSRDDAQQTARTQLATLLTAAEAAPADCAAAHALMVALTAYVLDR